MNTITDFNYQTSFGMKKGLQTAEIIQRKAKNVYPHVSPYRIGKSKFCERPIGNEKNKFYEFASNLQKELEYFRNHILSSSRALHETLVKELKSGLKLGNSAEEVELASIIGRINGQNNIYSASIDGLDHGVCFITGKAVKEGKSQVLKDKDAIVIDPQLGITDYAGNYFVKLKEFLGRYKIRRRNISVTPHKNQLKDEKVIEYLKKEYPELVINDYKKVQV